MKKMPRFVQMVSALALFALTGCCCATSHHASRAWEYRIVQGWPGSGGFQMEQDRAELERQLNEAGAQGYAVVSSTTVPGDATHKAKTIVILKRPNQ